MAEFILASLHDGQARAALEALAAAGAESPSPEDRSRCMPFPSGLLEHDSSGLALSSLTEAHRSEIIERARRGVEAVRSRPLVPDKPPLEPALAAAGWLFDAGLYFEVHELLEAHWREASGEARESLQGLIQVAVGFEHLGSGNIGGAIALLHDGCARLLGHHLAGRDLDPFGQGVRRCLDEVIARRAAERFDWKQVPRFPTPQ